MAYIYHPKLGRVGIIANPSSVLPDLTHVVDVLAAPFSGVDVVGVFGPEHGFRGAAQAGHAGSTTVDPQTNLSVYNIYGLAPKNMTALFTQVGVETIVFDVQDVGARFYTFVWTMWDALVAAAASPTVTKFVVLDRPNPIGGVVIEGPVLEMEFASFIGRLPIALRHGS